MSKYKNTIDEIYFDNYQTNALFEYKDNSIRSYLLIIP